MERFISITASRIRYTNGEYNSMEYNMHMIHRTAAWAQGGMYDYCTISGYLENKLQLMGHILIAVVVVPEARLVFL